MKKLSVNLSRLLLSAVLIVSGFVKAVDPHGTQYKLEDYAVALGISDALPDIVALMLAVALAAVEFCLGVFLLFAIRRRIVSRLVLLMFVVMTPLTLWLAIANPITDCGCFGDAIILTNWETFLKNVVLLLAALIVAYWPTLMFRFVSKSNQWIVINYSILFILVVAGWSLYDLPQFDFRPYHIGASIRDGMTIPEGAPQSQYETTFILEKDGQRREFTLDDYPDSTWTFIDSRTTLISEGYVPPIHDFTIQTNEGDDIAADVLADTTYTFLLVSPQLDGADDSRIDIINELYEYSLHHGYPFYCLTASPDRDIDSWRDVTGAEYPFCHTDETTLKTIIRSNPGLLLIKDGTVICKWSHNNLPVIDDSQWAMPLHQLEIGHIPDDSAPAKVLRLMLWFVLPLLLLTIADRLWAWSRWLRRKPKAQTPQDSPSAPKAPEIP